MRQRPSTLQRQTDAFRAKVLAMESESTRLLSQTYADALTVLEPRILALSKQIEEARANGQEPGISWLFQQERYQELRRQLLTLMDQYGEATKLITTEAQKVIVRESLQHAGQTLLSVSGGSGEEIATLARGWASVPDESIINLVGAMQSGTPVDAVIQSYGVDAVQDVQQALTRGLALGDSAQMTTQVIRALGVTRARAESLVRTETMRAARSATAAAYEQSGVVTKLRWSASLSERTCGFCLSRHGKLFPLGTTMATHPACRCSWSPYLGKGLSDQWQSGESWLKEQPLTVQQDILGKLGAADFNAGNLQLADFERTGFDKDWGPTGYFGGVGHARQVATRDGRAPAQWATLDGRKAVSPAVPTRIAPPTFGSVEEAESWMKARFADGVRFESYDLAAVQTITNAVDEVAGQYGIRFQSIDGIPGKKRALNGAYIRDLRAPSNAPGTLYLNPAQTKSIKAAERHAAKVRQTFQSNLSAEITKYEAYVADPKRTQILLQNQMRLTQLKAYERWTVASSSPNPLRSLVLHESGHAVYYQHSLEESWIAQMASVAPEVKAGVSQYGASSSAELFAETFAAYHDNLPLPPEMSQAMKEVLNAAKRPVRAV